MRQKRKLLLAVLMVGVVAVGVHQFLVTPARAAIGPMNFFFISVVQDAGGTILAMNGTGKFNPAQVEGHGSFTHINPSGTPPFPVIGSGTWKAKKLISFTPTSPPTYGAHAAGVLEMEIHLVPDGGSVIPATLTVVCNIPPASLFTGLPEGIVLTVPSLSATFGPAGPTNVTLFSTGIEQKD